MVSCPKCSTQMRQVNRKSVCVDYCDLCGGVWFDTGELLAVMRSMGNHKARLPDITDREITLYPCPRCEISMMSGKVGRVELELCRQCKGVFLDQGEIKLLFEHLRRVRPAPKPKQEDPQPAYRPYAKSSSSSYVTKRKKSSGVVDVLDEVVEGIFSIFLD